MLKPSNVFGFAVFALVLVLLLKNLAIVLTIVAILAAVQLAGVCGLAVRAALARFWR